MCSAEVLEKLGWSLEARGWIGGVLNYVLNRRNEDGGYAFAQGLDSNVQDTYYGLAILKILGVKPPNLEQTVSWLRRFPARDLHAQYYISKAFELCGEPIEGFLAERILSLRRPDGSFGTTDVDVEAPSEFLSTFMATELLKMLGIPWDSKKTVDWLLSHQNEDGGFGGYGRSNLRSTFHAVAALNNLGYSIESMKEVVAFVRSCELPSGGFSVVTEASTPYMEDVYCGVLLLDLVGERCAYPRETEIWVFRCLNSNGGFRRSAELGISTFEDTYFALSILRRLGRL
ncbi:MAG: prenyltransferase/squalene oxidase repeat-containing protein [Candidatus Bathyarchaeia archaeon]